MLPGFLPRYWLNVLGVRHGEYFHSAQLMLETQLRAKRWLLETIVSDESSLSVYPDLCHHDEAWALGCEVNWDDDLQPWIVSHPVRDERDLSRVYQRDPDQPEPIAHCETFDSF